MLLCRRQRPFPSAVHFVGKEGGMGFAPALQPHKIPVIVLGRLVNPADARCSRRGVHNSLFKAYPKLPEVKRRIRQTAPSPIFPVAALR
jgi:hypothetical protein